MARRIPKVPPQEESLVVGNRKSYYYFGLTKKFLKFVWFI